MNDEDQPIHYTDEEKIKRLAAWHAMDEKEIAELKEANASLKAQLKNKKTSTVAMFLMGWTRPRSLD